MNNTTFVHKYIKPLIKQDSICVDMTAGNGNDTLFLASLAKKVYAFDISKEAINNTREKIKDKNNVNLIHDSHTNIDRYLKEKADLFIYNLGYLPKGEQYSVTEKNETLKSFIKAYELLNDHGYIIITFYLGHTGGKDEYYLLDRYIKENRIKVIETYRIRKTDAPITYVIKKF